MPAAQRCLWEHNRLLQVKRRGPGSGWQFGSLQCGDRCVRRQSFHSFGQQIATKVQLLLNSESSRLVQVRKHSVLIAHAQKSSDQKAVCLPCVPCRISLPNLCRLQPRGCASASVPQPQPGHPLAHRLRPVMRSGEATAQSMLDWRGQCMPCRSSNCAHSALTACAPTHDRPRCRSHLLWTHAQRSCSQPGARNVADGRKFAESPALKKYSGRDKWRDNISSSPLDRTPARPRPYSTSTSFRTTTTQEHCCSASTHTSERQTEPSRQRPTPAISADSTRARHPGNPGITGHSAQKTKSL